MQPSRLSYPPRIVLLGLSLLLPLLPACQRANVGEDSAKVVPAAAQETASPQEFWDAFYIRGTKVGYAHTTISKVSQSGRPLLRIETSTLLSLSRFGQHSEQQSRSVSVETLAGQVVAVESQTLFGPTPIEATGRVVGDEMLIDTVTTGKKQTTKLPWSSDVKGFFGLEQSLLAEPLRPGGRRTFKTLLPVFNQVVDMELIARDVETTDLPGGSKELLRIDSIVRLDGGATIESALWTDAEGQVLKTRMDALDQESFRTTRAEALAAATGPSFDLGKDSIVKLSRPLANAHQTRRVCYLVELDNANPADVFAAGPAQAIEPVGPHKVEITVVAQRHGQGIGGNSSTKGQPPGDEDLAPNSLVQSDDPAVVAMAREAAGDVKDPLALSLALEKYVHGTITRKDFSQAFATAADVARSREGDCTEHAVLLAALARACQIPSRVAIGLVYVSDAVGFGFHMWTEVYVGGRWTALDATLGQGGIGAAHLKLTDSNLKGASAYSSFLPVAQVLGRLKIEVLSVE